MADSMWSKHSTVYNTAFHPVLSLFAQDALTIAKDRLPSGSADVLDVACGCGAMTLLLCQQQKNYKVLAADHADGMLNRLRENASRLQLTNLETKNVNGETLEGLNDNSFDIVTSSFGIYLFSDRPAGWKSAYRVLKPNGYLVTSSWSKESPNLTIIGHILKSNPNAKPPMSENPCVTKEGFKKDIENGGFRDVQVYTTKHEFVYPNGKVFLDALFDNPFITAFLVDVPQDVISSSVADFFHMSSVEEMLRSPVFFTGEAFTCIARK